MSVNTETVEHSRQTYVSAQEATTVGQKSSDYGKTIGTPKLSEEGKKYYEGLKKEFGNMDFILVSSDKKEQANSQAAAYANPNKTVVLIDEEKIEKMATDETFRKQYEGIIQNAATGIASLKTSLQSTGANVKGYGIKINDGGTLSLFAVLKQSSAAQKERIARKTEEGKAEKKAEEKKTKKQEKLDHIKEQLAGKDDGSIDTEETVMITAGSVEELVQKVSDYVLADKSNHVMTQEEQLLGQHIDFRG